MERNQVETRLKWKIEDMFASVSAWQTEYDAVLKEIDFSSFIGKLGDKEQFKKFNAKSDELSKRVERLYVYAMMTVDTDTRSSDGNKLLALAQKLYTKLSSLTAFAVPELLSLEESVLKGYINDVDFSDYDYTLKRILEKKEHVLSPEIEELLASMGEVTSTFKEIFSKIDNADLPIKTIKHNGESYKLTHGEYSVLMQSDDRALRRKAFCAYYDAFISVINTITSTYRGNVKKNVFYKNARKYESCLNMALKGEDVPDEVYHNLIESVHDNLPIMHKYIKAKRKALNLKTMHMYDMYVPITKDADIKMEYDEAYDYVVKALSVLGEEYQNILIKAKQDRWLDVVETDGKRSGAYSVSVYDCHPYVLLNYQKTTHDVFTIAHEMGHSIHSYFSNRTQPYAKADYTIFVAEVASTVNEVLLHRYILDNVTDVEVKKYILSYFLEMIRTTLFRQTQFAEFEHIAHKTEEDGTPLTKDFLNETYLKLNKNYYGNGIVSDERIAYEWCRIPHFYNAFYVYKYSTGIISALSIADRILTEGEPAVKDYFKFLSSGGSDSPVELLKLAGVDLTKKDAYVKAMETFKYYLDELEKLL